MNKQKLNIKQWSKADRPREKMMAKGSEALSDAELLGILIGSGNTEENDLIRLLRVLGESWTYLLKKKLTRLKSENLTL